MVRIVPLAIVFLTACTPVQIQCGNGQWDNTCYCADGLSSGTADSACDLTTIAPMTGSHAICCANPDYPNHTAHIGSPCSCFAIADGTGCPGTGIENGAKFSDDRQYMTKQVDKCN